MDFSLYSELAQKHLGPAGYFYDTKDRETYLEKSIFLPDLNNERNFDETAKENIQKLKGFLAVMFSKDEVIFPKESAWFS